MEERGRPSDDDHELLRRARKGDDDAFGVLYGRHRRDAARYALRLVHRVEAAEDVASDAFARVLLALRGGAGPRRSFRPYLLIVVRQLAVAAIAAQDRIAHAEVADAPAGGPLLDSTVAVQLLLADAIARLPDRQRTALWLLEVEGWTVPEVADHLGLNANAVSALSFRARQSVRNAVIATLTAPAPGASAGRRPDRGAPAPHSMAAHRSRRSR